MTAPCVSVLMTTYNGATLIGQSIDSILSQTLTDFELVIVDDASTDDTVAVIERTGDPRIRLIRNPVNLGVVGARNHGLANCRGAFIACIDHDDLSRPHRLRRQVDFLRANPDTVLSATLAHNFRAGVLTPPEEPWMTDPMLLRFMLLLGNPLTYSSIMLRAETLRRLGGFMRAAFVYSDDFDLYRRLLPLGRIVCLDEPLAIYRIHAANTSMRVEAAMSDNAVGILTAAYSGWLGAEAPAAARLLAPHAAARPPIADPATMRQTGAYLQRLADAFIAAHALDAAAAETVRRHAARVGWQTIRDAIRQGHPQVRGAYRDLPLSRHYRPPGSERLRSMAIAHVSPDGWLRRMQVRLSAATTRRKPLLPTRLFGETYGPTTLETELPPTLFIVVDSAAAPNPAMWHRMQAILDRHAIRPIYLLDAAMARQPERIAPVLEFLARDACVVGAQSQPLPDAGIEAARLAALIAQIRRATGHDPLFHKAARNLVGPHTMGLLAGQGLCVDLSVMPGRDLRRQGGPDFRAFRSAPYWAADGRVLTLPTTGEGVGAAAPIAPIRTMLRRGQRLFVLQYHPPDGRDDCEGLERLTRYFVGELGGLAGDPRDLVRAVRRHLAAGTVQPV